jgi:dTDP-4-amino-4,6-dideoxygalactose transaminase
VRGREVRRQPGPKTAVARRRAQDVSLDALRHIPVYRASLPRALRLLPYLETIDTNRWYTNRGELVNVLEARLGDLLGAGSKVITAASGTAAIEAAILATAGRATPQRPLALLPAYTFAATASAVERCGYVPYLLDVEPDTWALAADRLRGHPMVERAGVILPVAPYGRAIAQTGWIEFAALTGVPAVIDAAAGLEALAADPKRCTGAIPVALSFQATKAFSSGEGGAVVWSDVEGLMRVVRSLNFGLRWKRESTCAGTNGKMSEYHAAVGLASLDEWDQTCRANSAAAEAYGRAGQAFGLREGLVLAPDIASNYALLDAGSPRAANDLVAALRAQKIESRRWYGHGLHREPYWRDVQRDALPQTDRIAPSVVGLPMYCDILPADIERTIETASHVLARCQSAPA